MTWPFVVLCVSALAIVALGTSVVTGLAWPWADRVVGMFSHRHRVRLWLWIAALPAIMGTVTVLATLLPAFGLGGDHCVAHDSHPHLCPHHLEGTPGAVLVGIALLVAIRGLHLVAIFLRSAHLSNTTARSLAEGSERQNDVFVFEQSEAQAFALGFFRPTIHVSRGLLNLGRNISGAVIAHEQAHARGRDVLWRALCPLLGAFHLPGVISRISMRLVTAQEMSADAQAADELNDHIRIANTLLALARHRAPWSPGLAFTHGDVEARVRALLEQALPAPSRAEQLLGPACLVVATMTIGALHETLHHGLEMLLGALS